MYIWNFTNLQTNESTGVKHGDLEGHGIGETPRSQRCINKRTNPVLNKVEIHPGRKIWCTTLHRLVGLQKVQTGDEEQKTKNLCTELSLGIDFRAVRKMSSSVAWTSIDTNKKVTTVYFAECHSCRFINEHYGFQEPLCSSALFGMPTAEPYV